MNYRIIIGSLLVLSLLSGCDQAMPASPTTTAAPTSAALTMTPAVAANWAGGSAPITPATAMEVVLLQTMDGIQARVFTLAFSGDGAYFAYKDRSNINVLDMAGGGQVFTLDIQDVDLNSFAFSADGRLLASARTIWDVQNQQVLQRFDSPLLLHPAFSPDGALLAMSGVQPIKIWDVASGQLVRTFEEQADNDSFGIVFSPDGALLADSGHNGRVTLWDVASGQVARHLSRDGAQNDVHDIAFSPDGKLLVSVGTDNMVRLWDVASGQILHTMFHNNGLFGVAFSPDGKLVASASCDRTVKLWEVASGRMLISLRHGDEVTSVAFSPDGALLASATYEQKIYFWGIPR